MKVAIFGFETDYHSNSQTLAYFFTTIIQAPYSAAHRDDSWTKHVYSWNAFDLSGPPLEKVHVRILIPAKQDPKRPLILLGHSLGGILIKQVSSASETSK